MSFAVEIKDKLIADGLVSASNFFVGPAVTVPAGNGPFTVLITTGGSPNEVTHDDVIGYEQPSAQIVVTASVRSVAETLAMAIRTSLMSVRNVTLSGVWYRSITADQQVLDFPLDNTSNRPRSGFAHMPLKPSADIVARHLGDSAVIIRLTTNKIYELNRTGTLCWDLIETGSSVDQIIEVLSKEFEGQTDALRADVESLLTRLTEEGLVTEQ